MAKANTEEKPSQMDRFIDAARELGCDEDGTGFKEKLKVIARQKPMNKRRDNKADWSE